MTSQRMSVSVLVRSQSLGKAVVKRQVMKQSSRYSLPLAVLIPSLFASLGIHSGLKFNDTEFTQCRSSVGVS